jgi:hypothetical protein
LQATAKPRFSAFRMICTSPPSLARKSAVPSVEPLSTTITSNVASVVTAASFTRHCSVSSTRLKTGMTIEQSYVAAGSALRAGVEVEADAGVATGAGVGVPTLARRFAMNCARARITSGWAAASRSVRA